MRALFLTPFFFSFFIGLPGNALGAPGPAGASPTARAGAVTGGASATTASAAVTLADLPKEDLYSIHGTFDSAQGVEAVWKVLSDYGSLAGVLSGMESSRVLERRGNEALIEQVMRQRFLVFDKTIVLRLRIREKPFSRIDFAAEGKGAFRHYQGAWTLSPEAAGCRVDYDLRVSRGDLGPRFVERRLLRENFTAVLGELRAEITRRAGLLAAPGRPLQ